MEKVRNFESRSGSSLKVRKFHEYFRKVWKITKNELRKCFTLILVQLSLESYPTNKNFVLNSVSAANMCVCVFRFTEEKIKKVWKKSGIFILPFL